MQRRHVVALVLLAGAFKLLLAPAYHSTDFEVHRNWLAITSSLPLARWYYDETSAWTLDYPPLFAYFEYALALPARLVEPRMLNVSALDYGTTRAIYYQRATVIVTEAATLGVALFKIIKSNRPTGDESSNLFGADAFLAVQFMLNYALIIVDNIHFQYNGFLFGIMMLSVYYLEQRHWLIGAFLFSALINFKHIYLYVAPAYFLYILIGYCVPSAPAGGRQTDWARGFVTRLVKVGAVTLVPFALSLGPFAAHLPQLLARLFPFKRGLCHAYWAPNAWSLYNIADKVLSVALGRRGSGGSMTGGLVQDIEHVVLPKVAPVATFALSALAMALPLGALYWVRIKSSSPTSIGQNQKQKLKQPGQQLLLLELVSACAFASFLFGWHVHEKAVLLVLLPLSLLATRDVRYASVYYALSAYAGYSLFPLLFTSAEYPLKALLFGASLVYNYAALCSLHAGSTKVPQLLPWTHRGLLLLMPIVELYVSVVHPMLGLHRTLPYLPLMLISVYCACGVFACWLHFLWIACRRRHA